MKITGFDAAGSVPEGAVIERIYYAVPSNIVPLIDIDNDQRGSMAQALDAAIKNATETEAKVTLPSFKAHVTVDVRWVMKYPQGGGQDTVAQRFHYDDIADAQAHLDRINRFANQSA